MPAAGSRKPWPMTACDRVDLAAGVLVFESPKKRRATIFRRARTPCPTRYPDMVHGVRDLPARRGKRRGVRLWPVADDRTARGACGDAGRRARGCSALGQKAAAGFRGVLSAIAPNLS